MIRKQRMKTFEEFIQFMVDYNEPYRFRDQRGPTLKLNSVDRVVFKSANSRIHQERSLTEPQFNYIVGYIKKYRDILLQLELGIESWIDNPTPKLEPNNGLVDPELGIGLLDLNHTKIKTIRFKFNLCNKKDKELFDRATELNLGFLQSHLMQETNVKQSHIEVNVPLTWDSLQACKALAEEYQLPCTEEFLNVFSIEEQIANSRVPIPASRTPVEQSQTILQTQGFDSPKNAVLFENLVRNSGRIIVRNSDTRTFDSIIKYVSYSSRKPCLILAKRSNIEAWIRAIQTYEPEAKIAFYKYGKIKFKPHPHVKHIDAITPYDYYITSVAPLGMQDLISDNGKILVKSFIHEIEYPRGSDKLDPVLRMVKSSTVLIPSDSNIYESYINMVKMALKLEESRELMILNKNLIKMYSSVVKKGHQSINVTYCKNWIDETIEKILIENGKLMFWELDEGLSTSNSR